MDDPLLWFCAILPVSFAVLTVISFVDDLKGGKDEKRK